MKDLKYYKLEIEHRLPKPVKHWKEFLKHPVNKALNANNSDLKPEEWGETGFLCLCCQHLGEFNNEDHADTGATLGYYVCDRKGCRKTARHELMPNLKKNLENINEEDLLDPEE